MIGIRSAITRRLLLGSAAAVLGLGLWSAQASASVESWTCTIPASSSCTAPEPHNFYETLVVPAANFDVALAAFAGPAVGFGLANNSNDILYFMGAYATTGTGSSSVYNYDTVNARNVTVYSYY
ncbi:MAG: hypothetical protein M3071_12890 [Actinomycetota bacterium]|nr:hypothetical protein [Actinomycetota bacterium]